MKILSNSVLLEKLRSSISGDFEESMAYLYHILYPKVHRFILKNKGQDEEVKDVFQDALLAVLKLAKQDKLNDTIKIEAYIFSICRNLWFKQLKKKKREVSFSVDELSLPYEDTLSSQLFSKDKSDLLNAVLKKLTSGCQTILLAFYYQRQTMEEIVDSMSLSSVQVAKNKKYKCMKNLKSLILESDYYKDNLI